MKTKANELLNKVQFAAKATNGKILDILGCIIFKDGVLYGTDLTNTAGVNYIDKELNGCVPAKELINTLKLLGKQEIDVFFSGKQFIIQAAGIIKIEGYGAEDAPLLPDIGARTQGAVFYSRDIAKLQIACEFVSKDKLRPHLQGVWVTPEIIGASDGKRLYRESHSAEGLKYSVILPVTACKLIKGFGLSSITISEYNAVIQNTDRFVITRLIDEIIPKWETAWPSEFESYITFKTTELDNIVSIAKQYADRVKEQIYFALDVSGNARIYSGDTYYNTSYFSTMRFEGCVKEQTLICFNASYLLSILKQAGSMVTIRIPVGIDAPVVIDNNYLLMRIEKPDMSLEEISKMAA